MKKSFLLLVLFLTVALSNSVAQQLVLKDIVNGAFRGEGMTAITPLAGSDQYAAISADGKQIISYSFKTGKQSSVLFDAAKARGAKIERVDGFVMSPDSKHMLVQTQTKSIYRRSFTAVYYIYNLANNKLEPLSDGGPQQTPVWSPDGTQVAFVRDNNIHLVKLLFNNSESQVTKDGKANEIINGIPDWVNEEEFSFNSAMTFSADSRQIVWVRYDEKDVKEYSLQQFRGAYPSIDSLATYPGFYSYKYPKAGQQNSKVSVLSYDIKSHQTRKLELPLDADGYVPRIMPTSDPTKVAVFTLNRHQDILRVYMANPLSTVCQLAIEDKVDKYINENVFAQVKITDKHIVLTSERDGYNHIYLYTLTGQLQRTVSDIVIPGVVAEGKHTVVTDVYGYDELTGDLYFAALPNGPLNQKVFVSRKNGKVECLTEKDGWNTAVFSGDFKNYINTWNDLNTPTKITLRNVQGKVTATLVDNKELTEKYSIYAKGKKELFSFTTGENVELYGWIVKPENFNQQKKYPVVLFQYGGPGSQQVKNTWNIGMNGQGAILEQYMAQQGYIVVCVDNRGTGGRGAQFEKCTYLRLGEKEAKDQVETALWLGRQSFVDASRIGIWGWSYGGWNTLMSMSEGRGVFAAGIAIAPPTSWRFYDTVYTERFMRTPAENKQGYDEVNPMARASQLHGALLLCHGLCDDNVHYQNTAEYVETLVQADKDFRQLVYTNRNHSIYGGNTRNHLFRQCMNFFGEHLK
ncbi:S9 family peptidase [Prevotella sp. E9-3]|uniref:S9 family peptidase n=1 Tax=Prevotella sp. E9-3 TaxID=2913621 RepID=UPI001EDC1877|nr:S9 family peptidase [Prevotella sp. E9-3]UKK49351.1 S9 family peptidase [Prevotella sp. E9-3]